MDIEYRRAVEQLQGALLNFVRAYSQAHGYEWRKHEPLQYHLWQGNGGARTIIQSRWDNERGGWALLVGPDVAYVMSMPDLRNVLDFAAAALRGW